MFVLDHAFVGQELKIDDLLPILAAEQDDREFPACGAFGAA